MCCQASESQSSYISDIGIQYTVKHVYNRPLKWTWKCGSCRFYAR